MTFAGAPSTLDRDTRRYTEERMPDGVFIDPLLTGDATRDTRTIGALLAEPADYGGLVR